MAAGREEGSLTDKQIEDIAEALPSKNIRGIAGGFLRLKKETVDSLIAENKDDKKSLNRSIIKEWAKENLGSNQVERLSSELYNASQDGYHVDLHLVETVLGISSDPDPGVSGIPRPKKQSAAPDPGLIPTAVVQAPIGKPDRQATIRPMRAQRGEPAQFQSSIHEELRPPRRGHLVEELIESKTAVVSNPTHKLDQAEVVSESFDVSSLVQLVKGFLKQRVQIVEIIHGSAVTIQALHSDVILHVPNGVYGIILGNIHTEHWKFQHLVSENDCIIAPMCEFFISRKNRYKIQSNFFKITVPHIVKDTGNKITVKYQTSENQAPQNIVNIQPGTRVQELPDAFFWFDSNNIDIFTKHFSKFFPLAEGINCCSRSAQMLIFSRLNPPKREKYLPVANVNVYFASQHYKKVGYREKIRQKEEEVNKKKLVRQKEIVFSQQKYKPSQSFVEITFFAKDDQNQECWRPHRNTSLYTKWRLDEVLKYKKGHICKLPPTELPDFYLTATERSDIYRVEMGVSVTVVRGKKKKKRKGRSIPWKQPTRIITFDLGNGSERLTSSEATDTASAASAASRQSITSIEQKDIEPRRSTKLTNFQIAEFGQAMRTLASYLDFDDHEIKTLSEQCRDDKAEFNRQILMRWANKPANSGQNQIRKLKDILHTVAKTGDIDWFKIQQILDYGSGQ